MFLLITAIPFFLLKSKNTKTDKVEFVKLKESEEPRDTIMLFEFIDGIETEYFFGFDINSRKEAYFYKDTINVQLIAGFLGGYNLSIQMVGDEYTAKLTNYDCTWWEDLKIKEQSLKLEDFNLTHNGKLKGVHYCEAKHKGRFAHWTDKVKIKGYFELDLVDVEEERKSWK